MDERISSKLVTQNEIAAVPRAELDEEKNPAETRGSFHESRRATARYLPLFSYSRSLRWVGARRELEHAGFDPTLIVHKIERRAGEQGGKEELDLQLGHFLKVSATNHVCGIF